LEYRAEKPIVISNRSRLAFWLKTRNEHVPGWQDKNPLIELIAADGSVSTLTPSRDVLSELPAIEAREGWLYLEVPLAGNEDWERSGADIPTATGLRLGFDSWGAPPLQIWLDGLMFQP
jgi:hypothetical protein